MNSTSMSIYKINTIPLYRLDLIYNTSNIFLENAISSLKSILKVKSEDLNFGKSKEKVIEFLEQLDFFYNTLISLVKTISNDKQYNEEMILTIERNLYIKIVNEIFFKKNNIIFENLYINLLYIYIYVKEYSNKVEKVLLNKSIMSIYERLLQILNENSRENSKNQSEIENFKYNMRRIYYLLKKILLMKSNNYEDSLSDIDQENQFSIYDVIDNYFLIKSHSFLKYMLINIYNGDLLYMKYIFWNNNQDSLIMSSESILKFIDDVYLDYNRNLDLFITFVKFLYTQYKDYKSILDSILDLQNGFFSRNQSYFKSKIAQMIKKHNDHLLNKQSSSLSQINKELVLFFWREIYVSYSKLAILDNLLYNTINTDEEMSNKLKQFSFKKKFLSEISEIINYFDGLYQIYIVLILFSYSKLTLIKEFILSIYNIRDFQYNYIVKSLDSIVNTDETCLSIIDFKKSSSVLVQLFSEYKIESYLLQTAIGNITEIAIGNNGKVNILPSHCFQFSKENLPERDFYLYKKTSKATEENDFYINISNSYLDGKYSIFPYISCIELTITHSKIGLNLVNIKIDFLQYGLLSIIFNNYKSSLLNIDVNELARSKTVNLNKGIILFSLSKFIRKGIVLLNKDYISIKNNDSYIEKIENEDFRVDYFLNSECLYEGLGCEKYYRSLNIYYNESIEKYNLKNEYSIMTVNKNNKDITVKREYSGYERNKNYIFDCHLMRIVKYRKTIEISNLKEEIFSILKNIIIENNDIDNIIMNRIEGLVSKGLIRKERNMKDDRIYLMY